MASPRNLVRLTPLHINEVPAHTALNNTPTTTPNANGNGSQHPTGGSPGVIAFAKAVLDEGTSFVDTRMPAQFSHKSVKKSASSKTDVEVLEQFVSSNSESSAESPIPRQWSGRKKLDETWFARRSLHPNQSVEGSADFDEFDMGLRHDHSRHEQEYTPDVFDAYKVLDWDEEIRSAVESGSGPGDYTQVSMSIYEMCHQLPFPLQPRVFPVLVVTAKTGRDGFIVVQLPIDLSKVEAAFYSNGRNIREGDSKMKRKKPVLGVYTSIERCKILLDLNIEWVMATASDAKGSLPMALQKLGTPPAVVKDVGLFMAWIAKKRGSLKGNAPVAPVASVNAPS